MFSDKPQFGLSTVEKMKEAPITLQENNLNQQADKLLSMISCKNNSNMSTRYHCPRFLLLFLLAACLSLRTSAWCLRPTMDTVRTNTRTQLHYSAFWHKDQDLLREAVQDAKVDFLAEAAQQAERDFLQRQQKQHTHMWPAPSPTSTKRLNFIDGELAIPVSTRSEQTEAYRDESIE